MIKYVCAAAATAVCCAVTSGASAATITDCGNQNDIDYTVTLADQSTALCVTGNLNESTGTAEFDGMTYLLGIGDDGATAAGSSLSWGLDPMDTQVAGSVQNWAIDIAGSWVGEVLLELKQGNSYALFDVTDSCDFGAGSCTGTWTVFKGGDQSNDLSHTRAWYKTGSIPAVPLPAAGWMLLAGLAGLGAAARRRK